MFVVGEKIRLVKVLPADIIGRERRDLYAYFGGLILRVWRVEDGGKRIAVTTDAYGNSMIFVLRDELWVTEEDVDERGIYRPTGIQCLYDSKRFV